MYAASSSAYGDTEVLPKVETMFPRPKSPYAAQKLMGEYYCATFSECYGLDATALRFFNVYGPRQDPSSPYSGIISIFMKCLLERTSPTIFGDGEQTRDFTYVEDVVELVAQDVTSIVGCWKGLQCGQRQSLLAEPGLASSAEDRGRQHTCAVWCSSLRGRPGLPSRHRRGQSEIWATPPSSAWKMGSAELWSGIASLSKRVRFRSRRAR